MAITYFLGAFNDNFFKQAALLLAVAGGLSQLQSTATMLFSIPFILFSAYAGWMADRFSKGQVVIGAKALELVAMLIGAYGIVSLNWNCVLTMVFIMSTQSTLFGPAINGSIPELYPKEYVTTANAILKLVTTLAILAGIATSGIALDQTWFDTKIPFGRVLVAVVVVSVSLIGLLSSFGVVKRKPSGNQEPFPWLGPIRSITGLYGLRKDPLLLTAIAGDAFFYFISSLVVLILNVFGVVQLELSKTLTSLLAVSLMIGVCCGSFLAAKIAGPKRWPKVMGPAAAIMSLGLLLTYGISLIEGHFTLTLIFISLAIAGLGGGLFLIPLTSFIQVRPDNKEKGKVIGIANFTGFSGIFLSGLIFSGLSNRCAPATALLLVGCVGVLFAILFFILFAKYAPKPNSKQTTTLEEV